MVNFFMRATPVLPEIFWDDPGLNVRYIWIFLVDHTFYKLDVKILATSNNIRVHVLLLATIFNVICRSASTKTLIVLAIAKEMPGTSLKINTIKFLNRKTTVELNRLLLKFALYFRWIFWKNSTSTFYG